MAFDIYMVESPEGRRYVGCTSKGAATRWATHFAKPPRSWPGPGEASIADAIKRFGRDAFSLTILATAADAHDAAAIETLMIERHGSLAPRGYNRRAASGLKRFQGAA